MRCLAIALLIVVIPGLADAQGWVMVRPPAEAEAPERHPLSEWSQIEPFASASECSLKIWSMWEVFAQADRKHGTDTWRWILTAPMSTLPDKARAPATWRWLRCVPFDAPSDRPPEGRALSGMFLMMPRRGSTALPESWQALEAFDTPRACQRAVAGVLRLLPADLPPDHSALRTRCVPAAWFSVWRLFGVSGPPPAPPSGPTVEELDRLFSPALGSGFVISRAGHLLTAAHVVEDCREVRARSPRGGSFVASVLARDRSNDLALLRLEAPVSSVAIFRKDRDIRQGESVVTVGFPFPGLLASTASVTTGILSALAGPRDDTRYLQVTASVQIGSSGGPLLDRAGHVIGIVVGKLDALRVGQATGDLPENVSFALRASIARIFLDTNGVAYEADSSSRQADVPEIVERAKLFTVPVECWR